MQRLTQACDRTGQRSKVDTDILHNPLFPMDGPGPLQRRFHFRVSPNEGRTEKTRAITQDLDAERDRIFHVFHVVSLSIVRSMCRDGSVACGVYLSLRHRMPFGPIPVDPGTV